MKDLAKLAQNVGKKLLRIGEVSANIKKKDVVTSVRNDDYGSTCKPTVKLGEGIFH